MYNKAEIIRDIAGELETGLRAFIHKTTGEPLFIPDFINYPECDPEAFHEALDELEENSDDYIEIRKWNSDEAFEMMLDFTEQLNDKKLKKQLSEALNKNKPFRNFKSIIDDSGEVRERWFEFKRIWQEDYVVKQVELIFGAK